MVGDRNPALPPDVDNPVLRRRPGDERKGDSKDDRVAFLDRSCALAYVYESEVAVRILPKAVSAPSAGTWWQIRLDRIAQLRIVRVEVEKVVAIELEQGLGDGQLARLGPGVRHVVELRGIVDRAEETRQVVEERVVTAPDEDIYLVAARRLQHHSLVRLDAGTHVAPRKAAERDPCGVHVVDDHADLGREEFTQVLVLHRVVVGHQ